MRRRPPPSRALPSLVTVLLLGLTACGGQDEPESAGLTAISVSGKVGQAPKVTWEDRAETDELESEVLVEGKGAQIADGDQVITHLWVGNGFSRREVFSTYEQQQPEILTVGDDQLLPAFRVALADRRIGSRVVVLAPPADAFGEQGNAQLDIGNTDDVVFVVDLTAKVLDGPSGTPRRPPADAPTVREEGGVPTGIDFSSAPQRPPADLQVVTLIEGKGRKVAAGDSMVIDYLGQVYRSDAVFDQSYDGEPFQTVIGQGQVIQGWDEALVGARVGSRVLLTIPPDQAYGEQGSGEDIPPDATLTFVVDLLAAY